MWSVSNPPAKLPWGRGEHRGENMGGLFHSNPPLAFAPHRVPRTSTPSERGAVCCKLVGRCGFSMCWTQRLEASCTFADFFARFYAQQASVIVLLHFTCPLFFSHTQICKFDSNLMHAMRMSMYASDMQFRPPHCCAQCRRLHAVL